MMDVPKGNDVLRFMTCGSVDDGKSTLIGHLLALTGNVYDDQLATLLEESKLIGNAGERIDYSLLLDGLIAEREQGITIDVAYRYFNTSKRRYIVADSPGHAQYTRNMATAASNCNAAIILIDARLGVLEQTRRHALICRLSGIQEICFAINKMDAVGWSETLYTALRQDCGKIVEDGKRFGQDVRWESIPVSALHGDCIATLSSQMPWYRGKTLLEWLEEVALPDPANDGGAFRFAVQFVIKPGTERDRWQNEALPIYKPEISSNFRGYAGRILGGRVRVGDAIQLLPSNAKSTVTSIIGRTGEIEEASGGMSVTITIADRLDISRGDAFVHPNEMQECSDQFKARIVWMEEEPLIPGRGYLFKSAFGSSIGVATKILSTIDTASYLPLAAERLEANAIGDIEFSLNRSLPFDSFGANKNCGSFLLIDRRTNATAGAGMIDHGLRRAENVHRQIFSISREARAKIMEQKPVVLWFTGLSGAGKSTIANLVERKLFFQGRHTMILDGDNVRLGLCKDLGFTEQDRAENIRRVGEAAKLLFDAGLIVLCAFVSPYRVDRDAVRALFQPGEFIEIYVDTPIESCEGRDIKGLYKKARAGLLPNFTGVNAPFEIPENPDIHLSTVDADPGSSVDTVLSYLGRLVDDV